MAKLAECRVVSAFNSWLDTQYTESRKNEWSVWPHGSH